MFGLRRCSGSVDVRAPSRSRRAGPSDRRASRARGRRRSAYEAPNGTGDRDAADRRRRIEAEPVPPRPRTRRLASRSNAAPASRSATLLGAGLGLRLLALAHDQHLLTVHLDGAPVAGCLVRGLRSGAALAPLLELLLQVLEHPAPPAGLLALHEVLERAGPVRTAQLAERLGLDLPDALARHREALPDLLEGVVGLLADAEAQPQDLLLARRERGEDFPRLLLQRERHGGVGG